MRPMLAALLMSLSFTAPAIADILPSRLSGSHEHIIRFENLQEYPEFNFYLCPHVEGTFPEGLRPVVYKPIPLRNDTGEARLYISKSLLLAIPRELDSLPDRPVGDEK